MNDIQYSALLQELLQEAKKIGKDETNPLTAERFMVALIDAVQESTEMLPELELSREMLTMVFASLEQTREALMAHINRDDPMACLDDLFMEKQLQKARKQAKVRGEKELDVPAVFACLLQNCSKAVQQLRVDVINEDDIIDLPLSDEEEQEENVTLEGEKKDALNGILDEVVEQAGAVSKKSDPAPEKPVAPVAPKDGMAELVAEVKQIRTALQNEIFGQDNAINVFAAGYFQARMLSMMDQKRRQPSATFLFAGPPGVGKTFLAETAAAALGLPFQRFDMSEYVDKEANIEFCGSDKVYKNGKAGNVTSFVAENPKCVLLFDEIEKAHLSVIHLFLQVLDAGRLRDNYTDKEVSFRDAIIILTTNAGRQLYEECADLSGVSRKVVIRALEKDMKPGTQIPYFPAAICSRFASGNVVMFNHVSAHDLRTIAKREMERHAVNLEKETGIRVEIDDRVYTALLLSEGSSADARTVRGRAETFFNDELYELLRLLSAEKGSAGIQRLERVRVRVELERAGEEIVSLFTPEEKLQVLVLADEKTVAKCREKTNACQLIGVQSAQEAIELVKQQHIDFALLDISFKLQEDTALSIEDAESPARDFHKFLREQRSELPVYLLETRKNLLSEEEQISFAQLGIRGVLRLSDKSGSAAKLDEIAQNLHQQASMVKLTRENKLVSFATAQTLSKNGKTAEIRLFDLDMAVAVDSEDAKSVLSAVSMPNVRFDDVIGAADAKQELTYFVEYLKNPRKYMGTGVKAPRGLILHGPPGTGKTMLAKAMACEAGVTFLAAEGNQFLKKYIGEGAEKVHELFRTARKYAPAILFIYEIDAIGKSRSGENNQSGATLTAFLTEMDGFASDPSKPVFVLAATNFEVEPGSEKSLDPALMRRFDRRVYIDLPRKNDRIRFLEQKVEKNSALEISKGQVENIALRTTGMSLADLDSVVELALRSAIRAGSTKVTDSILEEALETFNGGAVKKWDSSLLERVARHEAGHGLLCWLGGETPAYMTIVARSNYGGYMQHGDREGMELHTKSELLAMIRTSLGGRAAELLYYGPQEGISTGAGSDLAAATYRARQIVCSLGMDETFGLAVEHSGVNAGGAMSLEVRTAVNRILQEQMDEALQQLRENKDKLDALVEALLAKNHLNQREIEQVLTSAEK